MGAKTGIEWTDATWNPIRGCSRVSEGCRNCYAETMAARFSGPGLAYDGLAVIQNGHAHWTGKIEFVEKHLLDPLKWKAVTESVLIPEAETVAYYQRPRRIFVNSMSDLFHENVTDEMRDRIFAVMALCPQHIFQVLTKRPARMLEYLTGRADDFASVIAHEADKLTQAKPTSERWQSIRDRWPLPNVWLGVSVESQKAADERIPLLLQTRAAVRFISAEPLLGSIDLHNLDAHALNKAGGHVPTAEELEEPWKYNCLTAGDIYWDGSGGISDGPEHEAIDWVIAGGESGPGARPMHPDWARGLRDQCEAAGVPFFFKQWGGWTHQVPAGYEGEPDQYLHVDGRLWDELAALQSGEKFQGVWKVNKHAAGSLLDGVQWKQFPEAVDAN